MAQITSKEYRSNDIHVEIGFEPLAVEVYFGAPVYLKMSMKNLSDKPVFLMAGMPQNRPAYMRFTASILKTKLTLKDPLAPDPIVHGPVTTSIEIPPGESRERIIILNQFLSLEEIKSAPSIGIRVKWQYLLMASLDRFVGFPPQDKAPTLTGEFDLQVVRDDGKLTGILKALTDPVKEDWTVISPNPVKRYENVISLASLRILKAVPYLKSIENHPDPEIRLNVRIGLQAIEAIQFSKQSKKKE